MKNLTKKHQIISIVGQTSSGKTALAFDLANLLLDSGRFSEIHVVSADSKQVYAQMPILTGADVDNEFIFSRSEKLSYPFFRRSVLRKDFFNNQEFSHLNFVDDQNNAKNLYDSNQNTSSNANKNTSRNTSRNANENIDVDESISVNKNSLDNVDNLSSIFLHGIGIIDVSQDWSFPQFRQLCHQVLAMSSVHQQATIVVGGSGLYHTSLLSVKLPQEICPDLSLRQDLSQKTVSQLQSLLSSYDQKKIASMNNSDVNNPRRLIRAIEQACFDKSNQDDLRDRCLRVNYADKYQQKFFGTVVDENLLQKNIELRVKTRIENGAIQEVASILQSDKVSENVRSTLGFNEICLYLRKELSFADLVSLWSLHEYQYAKRQLTWWRNHDVRSVASAHDIFMLL